MSLLRTLRNVVLFLFCAYARFKLAVTPEDLILFLILLLVSFLRNGKSFGGDFHMTYIIIAIAAYI